MMLDSSQEWEWMHAPRMTVHRLMQTPSSMTTSGPIVTLGPILQFLPILAVGSCKKASMSDLSIERKPSLDN